MTKKLTVVSLTLLLLVCTTIAAQAQSKEKEAPKTIPAGSKVYVAPMDGFETFLKAALIKKEVPLVIVEKKEEADFEITGSSNSQKAGVAKKLILGSWQSREEATINLANLKTGVIIFGYSVHKENSAHGKKSTAEACAKHLNEKITKK